jgi:hypothetical protein
MMPEAATRAFTAHASLVARRARKGKGKAVAKTEDNMEFKEKDRIVRGASS